MKNGLFISLHCPKERNKVSTKHGILSHLGPKMPRTVWKAKPMNPPSLQRFFQSTVPASGSAQHSPSEGKDKGQRPVKGEIYLNVEVCEESNQGNHVSNLEIQPPERKGTRPDHATARLDDCQHKLDLEGKARVERWQRMDKVSTRGLCISACTQVSEPALLPFYTMFYSALRMYASIGFPSLPKAT